MTPALRFYYQILYCNCKQKILPCLLFKSRRQISDFPVPPRMTNGSAQHPPLRNDRHYQLDYWRKEPGNTFRGQSREFFSSYDPLKGGLTATRYHDLPLKRFTDELVIQSPNRGSSRGTRGLLQTPPIKFHEQQQVIPSLLSSPILPPNSLPTINFQMTNVVWFM